MFHVKHCQGVRKRTPFDLVTHNPCGKRGHPYGLSMLQNFAKSPKLSTASFSDAEVPENNVENVVNVDAAGEAAQGARSEPQFLS